MEAIAAAHCHVQSVIGVAHRRRFADDGWFARNGRERMVRERHLCAALALELGEVGLRDAVDAQMPLLTARLVCDCGRLGAEHLADQRSERGEMTARLPREHLAERGLLRGARAL